MQTLMLMLVNVGLLWAVLAYLVLVTVLLERGTHGPDNGAVFYILTGILTPVLVTFWLAFGMAVARGDFDWLGWTRGWQYLCVLGGCLGLMLLVFGVAIERKWTVAGFVVPPALVVMAFLLVYRAAPVENVAKGYVGLSALGVLVMAALLAWNAWFVGQRQVLGFLARGRPDSFVMGMVEQVDPRKDFGQLLSFTSRSTHREVRRLALQKMHSVQDWEAQVERCLGNGYHSAALTFVRDNEVPDPGRLVGAIGEAIRLMEEDEREGRLYPVESEKAKVRAVVEKYRIYGLRE